jgi:hypothetical protein
MGLIKLAYTDQAPQAPIVVINNPASSSSSSKTFNKQNVSAASARTPSAAGAEGPGILRVFSGVRLRCEAALP